LGMAPAGDHTMRSEYHLHVRMVPHPFGVPGPVHGGPLRVP